VGANTASTTDWKAEELKAAIREIQERVRSRYPNGTAGPFDVPLADLMPLLHARDAAEGKVASIGTVNPRPPGLVNSIIQFFKRQIARALDWHVREQVEFNRGVMACVQATLDALNETNRALQALGSNFASRFDDLRREMEEIRRQGDALQGEARELKDIRTHWSQWRQEWERKLSANEIQFLRSVADLQGAFQHRVTLIESNFRDTVKAQHTDFSAQLQRAVLEIQKKTWEDLDRIQRRTWEDLDRIRTEYERVIHNELRVIRQRAAVAPREAGATVFPVSAQAQVPLDYARFEERFRGTEEYVRENQRQYVPFFAGCRAVLDIGCGRGEFLDLMKEAGIPARGIDLSEESVRQCRARGLEAEVADLFAYLEGLPEGSIDGVFCAQVVEHLPPERVPEMIRLIASRIARDGRLVIETPNPECLAIFATHFYIDPTHERPVPPALLGFYLEEFGFGRLEVRRLYPAEESMPAVKELPEEFRRAFFGGLDYAILGRKL
jgi:2-polyprenyl-3-methyl-5-hydroxy-6-metoxy-1,4-benzoquinol methylase